jgi:outer membrane protein
MTQKIFQSLVLLVLCFAALPLMAQDDQVTSATLSLSESPRVAFVDMERVLDSSEAITSIMAEVDDELAKESGKIDRLRLEARRLNLELEKQDLVLSDSERRRRQQEILDLMAESDELDYRFKRSVKEKQRTTIEPLLEEVLRLIADVARREKFDLVVRGEVVLYGNSSVDLTPLVIDQVNSEYEELRKKLFPATQEPLIVTEPGIETPGESPQE